jgi:hypothetical protein
LTSDFLIDTRSSRAGVMADDAPEPSAAALAELEQLRAENQWLRGLLGLDARPAAEPVEVPEPTLFQTGSL